MSNNLDEVWAEFDSQFNNSYEENEEKQCCNNQSIIEVDYYKMCEECGLVLDFSMISSEAEWRLFADNDGVGNGQSRVRCGPAANPLFPVSSTGTKIAGDSKMSKIHMWASIPYSEKVLMDLKIELTNITVLYNLPGSVIMPTLYLFDKVNKLKDYNTGKNYIFRGNNRLGIISVCLYYACKNIRCNISSSLICKMFNIDKTIFSKCCKIYTEISDKNDLDHTNYNPNDFLLILANKLDLPFNIQKLISKIIIVVEEMQLFISSAPQSIISGIIYFISKELKLDLKIKTISELCDISTSIIVTNYKIINNNKNIIFNKIKDLR